MTRPEIVVDLAAIRHNVAALRAVSGVPVMAVVKADAYGHGMGECARAARDAGAGWLGVATLAEAIALRGTGDQGRLLCWLTMPGEDWAPAAELDIDITAYSLADLAAATRAAEATGKTLRLQLKVDTGLSRGGAPRTDWEGLFAAAHAGEVAGNWQVTGIWSHFACSDEPDHPANLQQEQAFMLALQLAEAAGLRPEVRHLANSAAAILRPSSRFDLVRCGIATYGLDPAPGQPATAEVGLRPAMTVTAPLAMVKQLQAGDSVSYGHTWTAAEPTVVGLVPLGYGEGIPRHAANRAEVDVAGVRAPVRGVICMDQFVVELGSATAAEAGDQVVVFGPSPHPTADDWAQAAQTINYEIVTRIGGRLQRRHIDSDVEGSTR